MRARQEPFTTCAGTVCNGKPGPRDLQYPHFCAKCGQKMRQIDFSSMHNLREDIKASGVPMGGSQRAE